MIFDVVISSVDRGKVSESRFMTDEDERGEQRNILFAMFHRALYVCRKVGALLVLTLALMYPDLGIAS